ncbi:hypothetical protein AX17_004042 [Amanita inopinata Kibby_2008]|nr:hypothetical protein AX17_004042 [Amanita inopinata Kibby_2008]
MRFLFLTRQPTLHLNQSHKPLLLLLLQRAHFSSPSYSTHGSHAGNSQTGTGTGTPTDSSWLYPSTPQTPESGPDAEPELLLRFVKEQRYGAAERILHQLLDSERLHQVTPHPAFEFAALSALRWDDPHRSIKEFTTWFNLVPDIYHPNSVVVAVGSGRVVDGTESAKSAGRPSGQKPFRTTMNVLFRSGEPFAMIPVIKQFSLLCALKGYIRHIYPSAMGLLARGVQAPELAQFLKRMEVAAVRYEAAHSPRHAQALARWLRISAVRRLCQHGWDKQARQVLIRNASDPNVVLPDYIYRHVIEQYSKDGKEREMGRRAQMHVEQLRDLWAREKRKGLRC